MKSEYRSLVEAIICDERKLAEISKIHAEAQEAAAKAAETLSVVEKRLEAKRGELARLDDLLSKCQPEGKGEHATEEASGQIGKPAEGRSRLDRLESEIDDLRRSFKRIADWYMSGNPVAQELPPEL